MKKQTKSKFIPTGVLDKIIADEAELKGCSKSAIIEENLLAVIALLQNGSGNTTATAEELMLSMYLPENKTIKSLLEFMYSENSSIESYLEALFKEYTVSDLHLSKCCDFAPIVQFMAHKAFLNESVLSGNEEALQLWYTRLEAIANEIEQIAKEKEDTFEKYEVGKNVERAKCYAVQSVREPERINLTEIYALFLDHWKELKNWPDTYHILVELAKLEKWENTAEERFGLLKISKKIFV